jgi:hypothetical protein
MHVKIFSMHTGIRSAATHRSDVVAEQFFKGFVNNLLYRWRIFLHLPATIVGAFIRKMKEVSHLIKRFLEARTKMFEFRVVVKRRRVPIAQSRKGRLCREALLGECFCISTFHK